MKYIQQKMRSSFRLLLFLLLLFIMVIAFQILWDVFKADVLIQVYDVKFSSSTEELLSNFFVLLSVLLVVFIFRKFVDKKTIASLGVSFNKITIDFFSGFTLAIFIIGLGTLLLISSNQIHLSSVEVIFSHVLLTFFTFLIVAITEEFLFRGYILSTLLSFTNKYIAVVVSASFFSAFHLLNDGISILAIINIFLVGVLFGMIYVATSRLWLLISLHLFWNFIQGSVLGYKVSGEELESIYDMKYYGGDIFTGGEFGFEGSIVCTLLIMFSIFIITRFQKKLMLI